MNLCLRKAKKTDFSRINELFIEMLQTIYGKEAIKGYADSDLEYYFAGGEDWICVAEIDNRIEAFLAIEVHHEEDNYVYYDDFSVSKIYRNKGIGSAMMKEAEKYCRKIGISTIVLHVEKSNTSEQHFYENRGFSLLKNDGERLCLVKYLN